MKKIPNKTTKPIYKKNQDKRKNEIKDITYFDFLILHARSNPLNITA